MIWQSASEFWAMGGYGVYVWGSMGVSAALMALEVWLARVGRRQALEAVCEAMDAAQEEAHEPDRLVLKTNSSTSFNPGAAT
ncbi:heme exporter protein CcmD [Limnohabitans sp.]|uniref:heme exporter protein CcmD n=1 Tax=Limnohabitans sp. TaxID=1907725 RepID=UPI003342290E